VLLLLVSEQWLLKWHGRGETRFGIQERQSLWVRGKAGLLWIEKGKVTDVTGCAFLGSTNENHLRWARLMEPCTTALQTRTDVALLTNPGCALVSQAVGTSILNLWELVYSEQEGKGSLDSCSLPFNKWPLLH